MAQQPQTQDFTALTNLLNQLSMGSGIAGLGGGLYNIFGKQKSPYDAASKIYGQIPGATEKYLSPYMQAGQSALGDLMGQYGQLTGSTGDVYNKLAGGYQQSPGFQSALKQALGAAGNQAAAGGMTGTPMAQLQSADVAGTLSQKDFGDYMGRMTGLYNTGLQGMGDIGKMGYGASTNYADMLGNIMAQQGGMAGMSQASQNQQRSGGISQLLEGLMGILGGSGALSPFTNLFNK
jgi:hypothetical protein